MTQEPRIQSAMRGVSAALLFLTAAVLLACGGGDDASLPALPGRLVFVDRFDGRDRLFVARNSDGIGSREIVIREITVLPPHDAGPLNLRPGQITSIGTPAWSPDGSQIALIVSRGPGQSQVIVVDPDTGGAFTASTQLSDVDNPKWSPDGRKLAYMVADAGFSNPRLATTELSGGSVHELLGTQGLQIPAYGWSSDARYVQIVYRHLSMPLAVRLIDVETEAATEAAQHPWAIPNDIWWDGRILLEVWDPEFWELTVMRPTAGDLYFDLFTVEGPLHGWFLSSPKVIAVEQYTRSGARKGPAIALFDAALLSNGNRYRMYSARTPIGFKWDFQVDPSVL